MPLEGGEEVTPISSHLEMKETMGAKGMEKKKRGGSLGNRFLIRGKEELENSS